MDYQEFLTQVVEQGIEGARKDYNHDSDKFKGAIQGFEACRGKSPTELAELLNAARTSQQDAFQRQDEHYWYFRCYEAEVEWTCNCVSAMLANEGLPPIILTTARGMMQAARIIGQKGSQWGRVK